MKSYPARCPVLLYHSQNVAGNDYASNDHVALANDLITIHQAGFRIIPLAWLVEWLLGERRLDDENYVCLCFDDGVDADVRDLEYPGFGLQRGFLNIMRDFVTSFGPDAQPHLHATSFVIASPQARAVMDEHSLFGRHWMNEHWWRQAVADPLMSIANHGWDHEHPDLAHIGADPAGDFFGIDTREKADQQILVAGEYIAAATGGHWPDLFAYPYGHVNDFLTTKYFPADHHHRVKAAFTTEPRPVAPDSDPWQLGRYVCGRDWRSKTGLRAILGC